MKLIDFPIDHFLPKFISKYFQENIRKYDNLFLNPSLNKLIIVREDGMTMFSFPERENVTCGDDNSIGVLVSGIWQSLNSIYTLSLNSETHGNELITPLIFSNKIFSFYLQEFIKFQFSYCFVFISDNQTIRSEIRNNLNVMKSDLVQYINSEIMVRLGHDEDYKHLDQKNVFKKEECSQLLNYSS